MSDVLQDMLGRWDAFELWLTQLALPFQVALAIVVVVPLCWFTAAALDNLLDAVLARWRARAPLAPDRSGAPGGEGGEEL